VYERQQVKLISWFNIPLSARAAEAKGRVPQDVAYVWNRYSIIQKDHEKRLRDKIMELLKEKWW